MHSEDCGYLAGIVCLNVFSSRSTKLKIHEWSRLIQFSPGVSFVLTSVFVFSVPVTDPTTPSLLNPATAAYVKMWRMSSLSSIMTIPTHRRTTSIASAARPAAPTRALPTHSSLRGTSARLVSWSGCWRRPGRPSTPNYCSWLTLDVEEAEEVAVPVSVAAPILTIPTWCTRMSVTGECVLWVGAAVPRTAAAAAAIAAEEATGTGSAPPRRPPLTEIAAAGTEDATTAPAPTHTTSTRTTTTAAAAAVSTAAPGPALARGAVEQGRPHLLHRAPSL